MPALVDIFVRFFMRTARPGDGTDIHADLAPRHGAPVSCTQPKYAAVADKAHSSNCNDPTGSIARVKHGRCDALMAKVRSEPQPNSEVAHTLLRPPASSAPKLQQTVNLVCPYVQGSAAPQRRRKTSTTSRKRRSTRRVSWSPTSATASCAKTGCGRESHKHAWSASFRSPCWPATTTSTAPLGGWPVVCDLLED